MKSESDYVNIIYFFIIWKAILAQAQQQIKVKILPHVCFIV